MKKECNKYEIDRSLTYPMNLVDVLNTIRMNFQDRIETPITYEQQVGIDYVLSTLDDRERLVIKYLFKDSMTLRECGDILSLSGERVRQIVTRALNKMRNIYTWEYLTKGYVDGVTVGAEYDSNTTKKKLDLRQDISVLGLIPRVQNRLKECGVNTILQFIAFDDYYRIRGIGELGINDIIQKQESLRSDFTIQTLPFIERLKKSNLSQSDKQKVIEYFYNNLSDSQILELS